MQAVLPPNRLSSCGQNTVLEKGTPTPGCHHHREAELVALCSVTSSARTEGKWDYVASLGGFVQLTVEQMGTWHSDTVSLKALVVS